MIKIEFPTGVGRLKHSTSKFEVKWDSGGTYMWDRTLLYLDVRIWRRDCGEFAISALIECQDD